MNTMYSGLGRLLCGAIAFVGAHAMSATPSSAQSGEVVYYGFAGAFLEPVIKGFNAQYPNVTVKAVTGDAGEIMGRIKAESGQPRADVVFLGAGEIVANASLFRPYVSKHIDAFPEMGYVKLGDDIMYYGYNYSIQTIAVNTDMMPLDEAPKSWADLLDPKYKGKILVGHPAQSGAGYDTFGQILDMFGWEGVQKYIENASFVSKTGLVINNLGRGEYPIALLEEARADMMTGEGYHVSVVYPVEGVVPVPFGIALVKGGPNPENAILLAEFFNSVEGQNIQATVLNRRVPRTDAVAPKGLPPMSSLKINHDYDYIRAAQEHDKNLGKFSEYYERAGR